MPKFDDETVFRLDVEDFAVETDAASVVAHIAGNLIRTTFKWDKSVFIVRVRFCVLGFLLRFLIFAARLTALLFLIVKRP